MFFCVCLWLTDAGGDGGAALLVTFGAAVAGDASDAILAGALACGLVARLAGCTHRVAVTGWGGGRGQQVWREKGKKKKRQIEYQYLKSGTVVTPYFVCHNPKSDGPDDVATLSHRLQNFQPVWSWCQQQQAVPGSSGFCRVFKGFDGSL